MWRTAGAPTGLAAQLHAAGIAIQWVDESADETGFEIERSFDAGPHLPVAIVPAESTTLLDTTAPDHGVSCYRVRAIGAGLSSAWAPDACAASGALAGDQLPDLVGDPPDTNRQKLEIGSDDFPELSESLLLKFDGHVTNLGTGPMHVTGNPQHLIPGDPTSHDVWQWLLDADGDLRPARHVPILFETDDDHNHFHLMEIVRYSLWDGTDAAASEVTAGSKVGFCMEDTETAPGATIIGPETYTWQVTDFCQGNEPDATSLIMGVTQGWRDVYGWNTNFQWVNVSDTVPGEYWLGVQADPNDVVIESDELNPVVFSAGPSRIPGYAPLAAAVAVSNGNQLSITLSSEQFDSDLPGAASVGPAEFLIIDPPDHGSLDVATGTSFGGPVVTYTPNPGYVGPDAFTFGVRDTTSPYPVTTPTAAIDIAVGGAPPAAPEGVTATPGEQSLLVDWEPPLEGNAVPTGYEVIVTQDDRRARVVETKATRARIDGLVNGTTYTVRVLADSRAGPGPASEPIKGVPTPRCRGLDTPGVDLVKLLCFQWWVGGGPRRCVRCI